MKSRILSLAAVAGLLVATGCSGGGSGTAANGIMPVQPPATTGSTKGTSSISASFEIPAAVVKKSLANVGRSAKYLSPGTGGLDILLGNGSPFSASAGASGTAQITQQVSPVNEAVTETSTGVSTASGVPPTGPFTFAAGAQTTVSVLASSYQNGPPAIGQTFTIVDQSSIPGQTHVSAVFTVTGIAASGTVVQGVFNASQSATVVGGQTIKAGCPDYIVQTSTYAGLAAASSCPPLTAGGALVNSTGILANGPIVQFSNSTGIGNTNGPSVTFPSGSLLQFTQTGNAGGQQFVVGSQNLPGALTPAALAPGTVSGIISASITGGTAGTYSYTFAPSTNPGYYTFTFNANGLKASTTYVLGVVALDYAKNFVLSENQAAITTTAGGIATTAFTLKPVVNGVYVPTPVPVFPPADGSGLPAPIAGTATPSFETTIFAVDEMNYIIPNQSASATGATPDNAPAAGAFITLGQKVATSAIFKIYGATDQGASPFNGGTVGTPILASNLTPIPVAGLAVLAPVNTASAGATLLIGATVSDIPLTAFAGTLINDASTPTAPFSLPLNPTAQQPVTGLQSAGNPLNIQCGAAGSASTVLTQTLTSTGPNAQGYGSVVGFTIVPFGTTNANGATVNYPATGATVSATTTTLNCTPGLGAVIN